MAYSFFLVSEDTKVQFPIAPSSLDINVKGRNETIDLMNEGEVNLLKSPGLTEVSFTAMIPQVGKYPFAVNDEPIDTFTDFLNDMLENKKTFRFLVVRTAGTKLLFDTNLKVSCEGYNLKESADNGFDVELEISLKQYRDYGIKTVTITKVEKETTTTTPTTPENGGNGNNNGSGNGSGSSSTTTATPSTTPRPTTSSSGKSYTVKSGDTLWGIAKKFYGSGSSWKKIYNKNKSKIESAAKKHGKKSSSNGHWIYPGTRLTIP